MKTITSVSLCVKNKARSNIYLDGAFFCSMDNLIVLKYGLKADMQIEEERLSSLDPRRSSVRSHSGGSCNLLSSEAS